MSRSRRNKSGKGPGYDYWSRYNSEFGKYGWCPGTNGGRDVKKLTARKRRRTTRPRLDKEQES